MKTIFAFMGTLSCILVGCVSQPKSVPIETVEDASLEALVHSTRDIQRNWGVSKRISALRFSENEPVLQLSRLEESVRRVLAFPGGYQGSLENLIHELATVSGYDYLQPTGKRPVRGVPIIFEEEFRTIAEYIYDAGIQAGNRATVHFDMKERKLQITYSGF